MLKDTEGQKWNMNSGLSYFNVHFFPTLNYSPSDENILEYKIQTEPEYQWLIMDVFWRYIKLIKSFKKIIILKMFKKKVPRDRQRDTGRKNGEAREELILLKIDFYGGNTIALY